MGIQTEPHTQIETSPTGLDNLGNTCYINATLQCIFNLDKFCENIINGNL